VRGEIRRPCRIRTFPFVVLNEAGPLPAQKRQGDTMQIQPYLFFDGRCDDETVPCAS
jgi:hypothetical protein